MENFYEIDYSRALPKLSNCLCVTVELNSLKCKTIEFTIEKDEIPEFIIEFTTFLYYSNNYYLGIDFHYYIEEWEGQPEFKWLVQFKEHFNFRKEKTSMRFTDHRLTYFDENSIEYPFHIKPQLQAMLVNTIGEEENMSTLLEKMQILKDKLRLNSSLPAQDAAPKLEASYKL